jgi:hypothetical protein
MVWQRPVIVNNAYLIELADTWAGSPIKARYNAAEGEIKDLFHITRRSIYGRNDR